MCETSCWGAEGKGWARGRVGAATYTSHAACSAQACRRPGVRVRVCACVCVCVWCATHKEQQDDDSSAQAESVHVSSALPVDPPNMQIPVDRHHLRATKKHHHHNNTEHVHTHTAVRHGRACVGVTSAGVGGVYA